MLADSFISIHAPPRGATYYNGFIWCESRISIHAPPRGATQAAHAVYLPKKDFNSRPSARGDFRQPLRDGKPNISIHAPPRGATSTGMSCRPAHNFNSRPSARGDRPFQDFFDLFFDFNSRPSARGDVRRRASSCSGGVFQFTPLREGRLDKLGYYQDAMISIHAPPRGATQPSADRLRHRAISIHAPPRGATRCAGTAARPTIFQFTPLREGRRITARTLDVPQRFQFTPLREGRRHPFLSRRRLCVFQFTPLREGRLRWTRHCARRRHISIHAPPRGATETRKLDVESQYISIHAPPRGATSNTYRSRQQTQQFQFTPLREGRLEREGLHA